MHFFCIVLNRVNNAGIHIYVFFFKSNVANIKYQRPARQRTAFKYGKCLRVIWAKAFAPLVTLNPRELRCDTFTMSALVIRATRRTTHITRITRRNANANILSRMLLAPRIVFPSRKSAKREIYIFFSSFHGLSTLHLSLRGEINRLKREYIKKEGK